MVGFHSYCLHCNVFETIYYKKNLPAVFQKLLMAFTEEEE